MMGKKIKVLVIVAMLLNLFDIWATLFILDKGGTEINPVMAHAIEVGPWFFAAVKVILFALAIILIAKRAPRFLVWIVVSYSLLALWHCYLLWKICSLSSCGATGVLF